MIDGKEIAKALKVKVLRADQSPLNRKQWSCELECGCEKWITSSRRPTKTKCSNHAKQHEPKE